MPFYGEHQAGIATAGPGPAGLRLLRPGRRRRRRPARPAAGLDRRGRPHDRRPARRRRGRRAARPAGGHRRGARPLRRAADRHRRPGAGRLRPGPSRARRPPPGRPAPARPPARRPAGPGALRAATSASRPAPTTPGGLPRGPQPGAHRPRRGRPALDPARLRPHLVHHLERRPPRATCRASRTARTTCTATTPRPMERYVWVGADEPQAWMRGGTYLVARRIRMLIEAWDRDLAGGSAADDRPSEGERARRSAAGRSTTRSTSPPAGRTARR